MALRLIVGLGNPGTKYYKTRHNAGFLLLDQLLSTLKTDWQGKKFEAEWARVIVADQDCLLLKPQTFMNLSGKAVAQAMRFYKLSPENIIVVHDDIDMPLGKVKIRIGGGHGGHNGIRSIMDELSADSFARLKLGVGRPEGKFPAVSDWVLSDFADSELDLLSGPMFKDSLDRLKSLLQPVK
jgi:PTH1 family peptidyl-tRNA hydrolase